VGAAIGLRHQHVDPVAHHLIGDIAEDALGGRVGRQDRAPGIDGDDAVHRRVQDRPDLAFAVAQLLFTFAHARLWAAGALANVEKPSGNISQQTMTFRHPDPRSPRR
jgi:hypothetical protein